MKRDYSSEIRMMKEKYSPLIINKTFWEGKSVAEFFSEYREIVTKIIIDYPKIRCDGILLFAGMLEDNVPFEKELLQARIFNELFDCDLILLPRFIDRSFIDVFNIHFKKGSLSDGFIGYDTNGKYIEFKLCSEKKLPQRITAAAKNSDLFFVCVYDLSDETVRKIKSGRLKISIDENKRGYVLGLNNLRLYRIQKNKEIHVDLLDLLPERIRGGRTDDSCSPTAIKVYVDKLLNVNENSDIDFYEYCLAEAEEYFVEIVLLYGGNPELIKSIEEYEVTVDLFARRNIRTIISANPNSKWLNLITKVADIESETKTFLHEGCTAGEFARKLGIPCISVSRLLYD